MKTYFLSSVPCALSVNGAYFGTTDLFSRHAQLSLKDNLFLCFSPENARPICFFLKEDIRAHAPEGVNVYIGEDFLVLYAFRFAPLSTAFQIHAQAVFSDICVSVFSQGETQCVIQTPENTFTSLLPTSFSQCEITQFNEYFFLKSPTHLAVYHKNGHRVFLEETINFSIVEDTFVPTFNATLPLSSALSRIMQATFVLSPDGAKQTSCSLQQDNVLPQAPLIGYAFLESLRLGLDARPFLSPTLAEDIERVQSFLKGYTAVTLTQTPNEYILTHPVKERIFQLKRVYLEIENEKIVDIKG